MEQVAEEKEKIEEKTKREETPLMKECLSIDIDIAEARTRQGVLLDLNTGLSAEEQSRLVWSGYGKWIYCYPRFSFDSETPTEEQLTAVQRLVAKITRVLGVEGKKFNPTQARANDYSKGLMVSWKIPGEGKSPEVMIQMNNYLPPSCHVVDEEEHIPAQPAKTVVKRRIICTDGNGNVVVSKTEEKKGGGEGEVSNA